MKKKLTIYYSGLVAAILLLLVSCNQLDLVPTNKFTDQNYWTSADKASSVLSMAYSQMFNSGYYFSTECLTDNLYQDRGNSDEKIFTAGQANSALGRFANEWSDCYAGIKTCHTFLENVDRVPNMDETLKTRMKAEARFIRAFLYFRMANQYGDVPLFDHNLTLEESAVLSRNPKADVIAFVRDELNAIVGDLPTKQQYVAADNGRITKGAVMMLLARTYLYESDWANVATICEGLMNGTYGQYALFSSYDGLFTTGDETYSNKYNSEVILDMGYALGSRTWSDYYDAIPLTEGGRISAFTPTQELVDDYIMLNGKGIADSGSGYDEDNPYVNRDPRLNSIVYDGYRWQKKDGSFDTIHIQPGSSVAAGLEKPTIDEYVGPGQNSSASGYYLRKWYDPFAPQGMASGLNLILMRYADVLLMYAEAKNAQGQMNADIWNETIGALRARAGFTDPAALNYPDSGSDLQNIIRRERRCELAIEGLRLFDIRRWKTAETVMNGTPHGAKFVNSNTQYIVLGPRSFDSNRSYLFAVPQSQIDIDKNLTQNPGY